MSPLCTRYCSKYNLPTSHEYFYGSEKHNKPSYGQWRLTFTLLSRSVEGLGLIIIRLYHPNCSQGILSPQPPKYMKLQAVVEW